MTVVRTEGGESVNRIDDGPSVEMSGWLSRATLDIIGRAGMGVEFDSIENPNTKVLSKVVSHAIRPLTRGLADQYYISQCLRDRPPATDNGSHESLRACVVPSGSTCFTQ